MLALERKERECPKHIKYFSQETDSERKERKEMNQQWTPDLRKRYYDMNTDWPRMKEEKE